MSDKTKKFQPPMGWIVEINHQEVSVYRVAEQLGISEYVLAKGLEDAGYKLVPDIMDTMADTAKIILKGAEQRKANLNLVKDEQVRADVADAVSELDEEENE